jgi:ferric-chelate reductase
MADSDSSSSLDGPLSDFGLDMTNVSVQSDFLDSILDDGGSLPMNFQMARAFWYGIVLVIGIAALIHLIQLAKTSSRYG